MSELLLVRAWAWASQLSADWEHVVSIFSLALGKNPLSIWRLLLNFSSSGWINHIPEPFWRGSLEILTHLCDSLLNFFKLHRETWQTSFAPFWSDNVYRSNAWQYDIHLGDGDIERSRDMPKATRLIIWPYWVQIPGYGLASCSKLWPNSEFANMAKTSLLLLNFSSFLQQAFYRNIKLNLLALNPKVTQRVSFTNKQIFFSTLLEMKMLLIPV